MGVIYSFSLSPSTSHIVQAKASPKGDAGLTEFFVANHRERSGGEPNAGVHFLLNGSACGKNGVVAVSLSTKLRWFPRGAAAFERTFPGLIASTLGKEFGAAYVCPICDRAFDLPPIMRS